MHVDPLTQVAEAWKEIARLSDENERLRSTLVTHASMIAYASELLAALKHAKTYVPFPSDAHNKITSAIEKAEGGAP